MAGYTGHERQYADGKASRCLLACTQGNAFQCCNVLLRNRVQCHGLATHNPWGGCSHLHLTCSHLERFKFISPKMAHLPLHMKYSEMTGHTTAPHLSPWCQPSITNTNYQLPDGPVKAGRRWGQRHPQGANLGSNGILKFLSKLKQSAATSPP